MSLFLLATGSAWSATCVVGSAIATHPSLQSAINTARCTAIDLRTPVTENVVSTRNTATRIYSFVGGVWVDGGGLGTVLTVTGTGAVTVDGVDLVNGDGALGGGVYVGVGAHVVLTDVTVSGNSAVDGAGIYVDGRLTVDDSLITANIATNDGGGVYVSAVGQSDVDATVIDANEAGGDGGGYWGAGSVGLLNASLSANFAGGDGGGAWFASSSTSGGSARAQRNAYYNNEAGGRGGGVYVASGTVKLIASTMTLNTAGAGGGGVAIEGDARGVLTNVTDTYNDAPVGRELYAQGQVWFISSIVGYDGAHPGGVEDCYIGAGRISLASVDGDGTCTGLEIANFGLVPDPVDEVWRPSATSVVADVIPTLLCDSWDQLHQFRGSFGVGCDAGAVER